MELRILEQTNDELGSIGELHAEAAPHQQPVYARELQHKLDIYWKQIGAFRMNFPEEFEGRVHESTFYYHLALFEFHSSGFMRRTASRSDSFTIGVAAGLIARSQESTRAQEALAHLDQALSIYDAPGPHYVKALIFSALGNKAWAIHELNYIINNFSQDDLYIQARQMKDALETPTQSSGPCFIATAAFGTPLAEEVIVLSNFRDSILLQSKGGSAFVALYYRVSPPLANYIAGHPVLRTAIRRLILAPVIFVVRRLHRIMSQ